MIHFIILGLFVLLLSLIAVVTVDIMYSSLLLRSSQVHL